jgi:hypothetical protein
MRKHRKVFCVERSILFPVSALPVSWCLGGKILSKFRKRTIEYSYTAGLPFDDSVSREFLKSVPFEPRV